jgi:hypothetical protein
MRLSGLDGGGRVKNSKHGGCFVPYLNGIITLKVKVIYFNPIYL